MKDWIQKLYEGGPGSGPQTGGDATPRGKNPIPEYQSKVNDNGTVEWQHKLEDELGGGVYKRTYPSLVHLRNDLEDKFGKKFANSVEKQLLGMKSSTNRT